MASTFKGSDKALAEALIKNKVKVPMTDEGILKRDEAIEALEEAKKKQPVDEMERKVRVIFHKSNNPNANPNYVFLSLNEKSMQAPYEQEVSIPMKFLRGCVDKAQVIEYVYDSEGKVKENRINIYPYTMLGYEDQMGIN